MTNITTIADADDHDEGRGPTLDEIEDPSTEALPRAASGAAFMGGAETVPEILPRPTQFAVRAGLHAMAFSLGALLGWSGAEQMGSRARAFESLSPLVQVAEPAGPSKLFTAPRPPAVAAGPSAGEEIEDLRAALEKERQAHAETRAQADAAIAALARAIREPMPSSAADAVKPMESAELAAPPNSPPVVVPQAHPLPAGKPKPAGLALLEAGRDHFRKGKLEPAREAFQKAAQLGLPEGALGVGTTYDPMALAKAGFTQKGEPDEARRWYRRAYQLNRGSGLQ